MRYTPKGTAVTDIRLAINRYYAGDNSERQEETTFVDVTLWNRQAEVAGNYLSKGRGVFVEGRLQLDSWEDKASGQKRTKLRVIGENSSSPAAVKAAIWAALRASSTRMLPVPITTDNPARPRTTTRPPCPPPISRLTTLETWTTKSRSKRKYLLFFLQAAFPPGQAVFLHHLPRTNGSAVPRKEKVVQPHSRQWRKSTGTTGQKGKPHRSFQLGKTSPSRHTGGV
nr:single-stranded DNA-binding protein [uncultured Akkermansia sp.]